MGQESVRGPVLSKVPVSQLSPIYVLKNKQALEDAREMGRGGVYLRLTPEHYARLRRP